MSNSSLPRHLLRYLIGGATTTVLTWSCVWLFVEVFQLHYLVSTNLATFVAYGYSFVVNKLFVFDDRRGNNVVKGTRFFTLQVSLLAFANLFMFVSVSLLGVHYMPAVVMVSVIAAALNFLAMRLLIFDHGPARGPVDPG